MARRRSKSGGLGAIFRALAALFWKQHKAHHAKAKIAKQLSASPATESDDDDEDFVSDEVFKTEVVGESSYRAALRSIFGPGEGRRHYVAHLVPEPTNKHDANAVQVLIQKQLVGYLSRRDALKFKRKFGAIRVKAQSRIVCREGGHGVWLDIEL